jgi:hypothetical protein
MSALADVVSVSITSATSNPTQAGFGTPLILSNSASAWLTGNAADVVREYTDATAVALDFATTTPEYKAASKAFSANPRPPKVLVGKGTLKPVPRYTIVPVVQPVGFVYKFSVIGTSGVAVPLTCTVVTSTLAAICAGILAAINTAAVAGVPTATGGITNVQLTGTAGVWFGFTPTDFTNIGVTVDNADPGVATDLAAINLVRSDWYFLLTVFNSTASVTAAAAWAQANGKFYQAQTQETNVPNVASGSDTTSVAYLLKASAYDNTYLQFSPGADDFLDAGLTGVVAPFTPGDETWKFKTISGCPVTAFTATQRTNMRAKYCNFYETTQGVPMTEEGQSSSGKYSDLVRYLNYLQARVGERVFGRLAAFPKVPYTDEGIAVVSGEVAGQLQEDEKRGAIAPGWTVSVPKAANVSALDKSSRTLRNVVFAATYAGAIHRVLISGSVSA